MVKFGLWSKDFLPLINELVLCFQALIVVAKIPLLPVF